MIFNSFVLLSVLSLSAFAVPHSAHNHRGLASRVSARETPALPHVGKKRSMTKRCRTRPPPVAAAADPPANPKPEVENPKPQEPKPKPQEEATKPPKDDSKPKPEEDKPKPTPEEPETKPPKDDKPAQSEPGGLHFSLFGNNQGHGTFYNTGLTACGKSFKDTDYIAAVSAQVFDSYPGATANPNLNPICGKKLKATWKGKSVVVEVQDRCAGCETDKDVDLTPTAFQQIADLGVGRIRDLDWQFI
ncbi:hypothetical protein BDV98DRAFT_602978 [Pterulicium gracile]|uniref:RlpA-like protein double-psi beta-barrel domain-containing protein n=1 Tax=Pterulicium gracile TaxID=1884261 RepID=A0A5C3QYV6_9AGAR|nr:hypothetical protein BDV98DRAFT_602978 [Pterula gracilis]